MARLARALKKLGHEVLLIGYAGGLGHLRGYAAFDRMLSAGFHRVRELGEPEDSAGIWYDPGAMASDKIWRDKDFSLHVDLLFIDAVYRFLPYWAVSQRIPCKRFFCGVPAAGPDPLPSDCYMVPGKGSLLLPVKKLLLEAQRTPQDRDRFRREMTFISDVCLRHNLRMPVRAAGTFYLSEPPGGSVAPIIPMLDFKGSASSVYPLGTLLPRECDADWDRAWFPLKGQTPERPTIVVSFGTTGLVSEKEKTWFKKLCVGLAHRFRRPLIVVAGASGCELPELDNLISFEWVSLWEMLSYGRNAILVSHGGMNSYRDAVCSGTPIVVIPQRYDQFAVAARVDALGFGISIRRRQPAIGRVCSAIDCVVSNPIFKSNCRLAKAEALDVDEEEKIRKLLDEMRPSVALRTIVATKTKATGSAIGPLRASA